MNRRKFLQALAALPFAGALWREMAGEGEAAPVITADDIIDTRPPLYTIAMGDGGSSPPAEVVYQDITIDVENGEFTSAATGWQITTGETAYPDWRVIPSPDVELIDVTTTVYEPDRMTITAIGSNGEMWQTNNNGGSWEQVA